MAILFLDAVNDTLARVGVVKGDAGALVTTTGATASEIFQSRSDIQHSVDLVLQMWREAAQELYSMNLAPTLLATKTIPLEEGVREYTLPDRFERIAGNTAAERVLRGVTTGVVYGEYPGGYLKMLADQPRATDFTGDPGRWAINPGNAATTLIRFEFEATAENAGDIYHIAFERRIDLTVTMATETMPFSDTVSFALVPVVAEFYERTKKNEFDAAIFRSSLARAARMGRRNQPGETWGKRRL